jgi:hypothetical protein
MKEKKEKRGCYFGEEETTGVKNSIRPLRAIRKSRKSAVYFYAGLNQFMYAMQMILRLIIKSPIP